MKSVFKKIFIATSLTSAMALAGLGLYVFEGLDDNGADSLDGVLETFQEKEEIGFSDVADIIRNFVGQQFAIRNQKENMEKYKAEQEDGKPGPYSLVYKDLPGESAYATRDVHRKTHGCFKANLNIESNLKESLNARVAQLRAERIREENLEVNSPMPKDPKNPLPELITKDEDMGLFIPGKSYDAIVRFSNGHPLNRHDKAPDARGFAVKILPQGQLKSGVPMSQQSVNEINPNTLLDILSINFPTFFVNQNDTSKKYAKVNEYFLQGAYDFSNLDLIGKGKDKALEGLATFFSGMTTMEVIQTLMVNGSIIKSPLFQEYFSMVPSRLGPLGSARAVKYFWEPMPCDSNQAQSFETEKSEQWPEWSNKRHYAYPNRPFAKNETDPYKDNDPEKNYPHYYLRKALAERLTTGDFCYGLYLQPYRDQVSTNIEDSTDLWIRSDSEKQNWLNNVIPGKWNVLWNLMKSNRDQTVAAFAKKKVVEPVLAATLRIEKVASADEAANSKVCEDLSFNPWNGHIDYHKPLGVISRLKRRVYNASRRLRHEKNQYPMNSFERTREERQ